MSIPYPTKDKNFLGLAVVEIINPNITHSPDEPTLAEWAGFDSLSSATPMAKSGRRLDASSTPRSSARFWQQTGLS